MKRIWAVLTFFMLAPGALAGSAVLTDETGDVVGTTSNGDKVDAPPGSFSYIDIEEISFEETVSDVRVRMETVGNGDGDAVWGEYTIGFTYSTTEFRVIVDRNVNQDAFPLEPVALLERRPVGGIEWRDSEGRAVLEQGPGDGVGFQALVPKDYILDESGTPPLPGRSFTEIWGLAREWRDDRTVVGAVGNPGAVTEWSDEARDETMSVPIEFGPTSDGTIKLSSPQPNRLSNGAETTYVYEIHAVNIAETIRTFTFTAEDVPESWTVDLPISVVEIESGKDIEFPVIVSTGFGHLHGDHLKLNVTADDVELGASQAYIELGVKYTEIPQPAGHHRQLWIHTAENRGQGDLTDEATLNEPYMNTLQEDTADKKGQIAPRDRFPFRDRFDWCIPLSPSLGLGLDFEPLMDSWLTFDLVTHALNSGTMEAKIVAHAPTDDPSYDTTTFCDFDPAKLTMESGPIEFELQPDETQTFEIPLSVVDGVNVIEVIPKQDLWLAIEVETDYPISHAGQDNLRMQPGASVLLPLKEYRDPAPDLSYEGNALITAIQETEVIRNPGSTAVFEFTLSVVPTEVDFEVIGTRPEWAAVFPDPASPNGMVLVVTVPSDAVSGAIADLVLRASHTGSGRLDLERFIVEVDTDTAHPSDEFTIPETQSTPSVALAWTAGSLIAVALRKRNQ